MAQRTIKENQDFAAKIKARRNELHLTIEEAAKRAGVGTKTWCRYEAGESIRQDKYRGVCKALNWTQSSLEDEDDSLNLAHYRNHEAWSKFLEDNFGEIAALSFAIGSDLVWDYIMQDLEELSTQPKGTHIGQLGVSFLEPLLPEQFLMNYDYDFLYAMKAHLQQLINSAKCGHKIVAHSVLDEIILRLIAKESGLLIEADDRLDLEDGWDDWVYDIFDDADVDTCLYSDDYLQADHIYHFFHWLEEQFYCDED